MKTGRKMKILIALQLLMLVLLADVVSSSTVSPTANAKDVHSLYSVTFHEYNATGTTESSRKSSLLTDDASEGETYATIASANGQTKDKSSSSDYEKVMRKLEKYNDDLLLKPILSPKDMFLQEIHTLSEEASTAKIYENNAQGKKIKISSAASVTGPSTIISVNNTTADDAIQKLLENEDATYEDDLSEDEENESDEEYYNPNDIAHDNVEESESDEQVMTPCPDYCRCAGEYAAATTAICSKLVDHQSFGPNVAHLHIENAGQIRLGPHVFQSWGLQQIKSITISDTKIVELNQTAFDGLPSLFSVNLTRNGLQDVSPNIFQSNKQLSLLAICGNPLKYSQDSKSTKHGLIAPVVSDFDFSFNGLTKLKRTAFSKMQGLTYINLKGNKLKEIDNGTFSMLYVLDEVNLSNNLLTEIPNGLFDNIEIQTLHITGNNLVSLSTVQVPTLRVLDVSNNKIKLITKDDLSGVPLLEHLTINSNGIKRIHQHSFAHLDQLTYLDISGNKLTSLTEHHFKNNPYLQVLLMNDNPQLETLPVFKMYGLEYNTFSIYRFECSHCGLYDLEKGTFDAMPALTRLNLSKNRLIGLPDGLLNALSSLRILDLSDNIIKSLDNNMFRGATSLTKLNLAGNPLVTLQVTPFLKAPSLAILDVSRCALERVWSEARVPLTSLRFLSVRKNLLRRITIEELKATPKLHSLDLSHNPFDCDAEFSAAIQWLTEYGIKPSESLSFISNYDNNDNYQDSEGISQWTELAKVVCDGINDGPPDRNIPRKEKAPKAFLTGLDTTDDSDSLIKNIIESGEELLKLQIDHGIKSEEEVEKAWTSLDQEYEDFVPSESIEYRPWYTNPFLHVVIVIVATLVILLMMVYIAIRLAKRRGHSPVIRPPMILRQGFIDNKNCGLVYKPLQEDIATPHVPKRGSFYSSSTFHYDKIVPESV